MPYLVDGNNLIGAIPFLDLRDTSSREKLTQLLGRYQRIKNNSITVVYDGPPPDGTLPELHIGKLKVIYAGPASDADTRIKKMVKSSADPTSIIVVSTDRKVYSYCRWAGSQAMQSIAFYRDMINTLHQEGANPQDIGKLSRNELDEWMDYFGYDVSPEDTDI